MLSAWHRCTQTGSTKVRASEGSASSEHYLVDQFAKWRLTCFRISNVSVLRTIQPFENFSEIAEVQMMSQKQSDLDV